METLLQDIRYGVRMLRKSPGFTVMAVVTLALGIACTATVFSIVNAALLQPLRYPHSERLMLLWEKPPGGGATNVSDQDYLDWREQSRSFEQIAAAASAEMDLRGNPPVRLEAGVVTTNFFRAVGVQPELGRTFTEEEARSGGAEVVILSHAVWQKNFGGDGQIIGKTITLDGRPWTVIGVMPAGFEFVRAPDVWTPLVLRPEQANRAMRHLLLVGRLRPGVTAEQAGADLQTIAERIALESPQTNRGWGGRVMPIHDYLLGRGARLMILILFGAVLFVLLIACANIANLLLARSTSREKEIAMRVALGARRSRVIRQLLMENLPLALMGGATGLLLSWWAVNYLGAMPLLQAPGAPEVRIDYVVLGFVIAVSAFTTVLSGLVPAWQVSKVHLLSHVKAAAATTIGGARHERLRGGLAVVEIALCIVLLAGAGLAVRSFIKVQEVKPGFNPRGLLTMRVALSQMRYRTPQAITNFYEQMLAAVRAVPGVQSADIATTLPITGWTAGTPFRMEKQPKEAMTRQTANYQVISDGYLRTLQMPVLHGRGFLRSDTATALRVAIINQSLAREFFKDENPVGERLIMPTMQPGQSDFGPEGAREIVGVVPDVKDSNLDEEPSWDIYVPATQAITNWQFLVVRSSGEPGPLTPAVRNAIASVDKDQPLQDVATMQERIYDSLGSRRFGMSLMSVFAMLALLLAAVGTYGVISCGVAQRTSEIGLRMALGAQPDDLLHMVLRKGLVLAGAGAVAGIAAAVVLTRALHAWVFGISTTDPLSFVAALVLLAAAALVASYVPARRATKVDPMVALRYE